MNTKQYDEILRTTDWLAERDMPVAILLTEKLEPSGGPDAVIFPPTYAFKDEALKRRGFHPYPISNLVSSASPGAAITPEDASKRGLLVNLCDLDSFGAQANRMEPAFKRAPLSSLVPQYFIKANAKRGANEVRVSLLDAGHRVADGAVRFAAEFGDDVAKAIAALAKETNADILARLAPTSLIFGFWDSRASQYKSSRILSATIRASNVAPLKRSAQFNPAFDPGTIGLASEDAVAEDATGADEKDPLSKEGLRAAPAVDTHGGIRVFGDIARRTEINLVGLRALAVTTNGKIDEERSLKLRRYLLGLALVAGRVQPAYNLRQGCLLVLKDGEKIEAQVVHPTGQRKDFSWEFKDALDFANEAAREYGTFMEKPVAREFDFQPAKVAEVIKGKTAEKAAKKAKKAKGTSPESGSVAEGETTPPAA